REHVRIVFAIRAERDGLDLDFIVPALGEQRANGAINDARGENFFFGGASFALEVTAGEFSRRSRFFAVIDSEREEILACFGLGRSDGCDEYDGFTHLDGYGTVRLFGEFPGFNNDLTLPNGGNYFFWHV